MYNCYSMNYAPYSVANLFDGTRSPSAVKNDSLAYAFWNRALYQRLCSVVEFDLPDNWKRAKDFFEAVLFGRGYACVFDSKEFGVSFQPAGISGYDFYYQPVKCLVSNPKLSAEFTIGEDCSLIKLTPDFSGVTDIIAYYAEKLATMDGAINMSIINSKFAYVFGAKNKAASQAVKMIFDKINKGEPLVVFDNKLVEGLGDEEPFEFIDRTGLKNSYIVSDLLKDFQTIINNFDTEIGIPTIPVEKKERMITEEATSRTADSSSRITLWNECLTNSIRETNKMFGTNISFKFKYLEEDPEENNTEERSNTWELRSLPYQE